jgi:hypothetical protein
MGLSKTGRLPRDARRPQAISSGRNSKCAKRLSSIVNQVECSARR